MADVEITDKSHALIKGLQQAVDRALESIGIAAQGYATLACRVDTGRLRNSITYATAKGQGQPNKFKSTGKQDKKGKNKRAVMASPADYAMLGKPEENSVWLGTNVEYARHVEEKVKAFIRPAIMDNISDYKNILEENLRALDGGD